MCYIASINVCSTIVTISMFGYKLGLTLRAQKPLILWERMRAGWIVCIDELGVQ
jgi:hypothetical protein